MMYLHGTCGISGVNHREVALAWILGVLKGCKSVLVTYP
jgi:hypothetical protein